MPPFTPYLAIRAVGNSGLVQPGRVIGANNFIPLGNPFSGLENATLNVVQAQSQQRIVQFENEIFCWQRNNIRQYNPATEDWDIVFTVLNQDTTSDFSFHSGLHFMHDKDGFPILIGFADHNTQTIHIRVKYGPDSFGVYEWTQINLTNSGGAEDSNKGVAVYQNQLYKTATASVILRYDPVTDLATQQNLAQVQTGSFGDYTDMIVFQNRLFHIGQTNGGTIHELVGGAWHTRRFYTSSNITASPSFFEHKGKLYFLYGEISGLEDGWRLFELANLDTGGVVVRDNVIPANWRFNSGTDRGAPNTPAPNWFGDGRSYVIIDQETDPANPRCLILIGSAPGYSNTMTAFEFIDGVTPMIEFPGGNLTGEMQYPHNNWGSGAYHWTSGQLNVQIEDVRIISNTEEEIDFVAFGDPGIEDKRVRIYYDNLQELPTQPITMISTNPTSGTVIMTDTEGDFIDGVDADGVTVYTVVRDFVADGAAIGQQEVLMPHIERPGEGTAP
jgi:hypothetical protein